MPKFLDEQREELEIQNENIVTVEDKHDGYLKLNEECRRDLTFKKNCDVWYKTNPRGIFWNHNQNYDLKNVIGIISLPYFDGSSNWTASSWIQNLDSYFQLNPMAEREAMNIATLHLDGEENDSWFHGMKTLGHDQVTT